MSWISWPFRIIRFLLWYSWAVITSNLTVLRDNLTPGQASTTGVARFVTRCRTDGEITLLASLITITPGTLTLGTQVLNDGSRVLFVHGMYAPDAGALRSELRDMERRMLHAVRRRGDES